MTTLRPNPIFFPFSLSSSSFHSTKTLNFTKTLTSDRDHYGPSLRRNQPPLPSDSGDRSSDLDRSSFSRTFQIPALRIPASACSSLENRLRGHLLNWPRVRNVARVPGDDLDPHIENLLRNSGSGESIEKMEVMSPVLYREKLVKDFNCRGFLRFRNLARMSRPKKRKKKKGIDGEGKEGREEERVYIVREVLEEEDDMRGLLGDDWCGGRWRGSTRLLLLDERCKDKELEELPEAVKV